MFGYGVNRKVIMIVLMIMVVYSLLSLSGASIVAMILTLPAVIIAITFHEYAHAFVADRLGDTTPRSQGRLTLNPLAHLDPVGFFLLMFCNIGWGKPVEINPVNFNSNKSMAYCEAMVSLAGPVMNFILALLGTIGYVALQLFAPGTAFAATQFAMLLNTFLVTLISVNVGLGVFNLIPLPPLDGEKIFKNILPYRVRQWLDNNYQTMSMVFMLLWIFGVLGTLVAPVINFLVNGMVSIVSSVFLLFI